MALMAKFFLQIGMMVAFLSTAQGAEPNLDDLWTGQAQFEFYGKMPASNESPTATFVSNGIWYTLGRLNRDDKSIPGCQGLGVFALQMRKSMDHGKTWSEPLVVADPALLPGQSLCSYVDASAQYVPQENQWYLLTQCLNKSGQHPEWDLCLLTRKATDPMGVFQPSQNNPVVRGGDLWSKICHLPQSGCSSQKIVDEGTPEFVAYENSFFYISFHGYDPKTHKGYRGLAKTKDFLKWEVAGPDLSSGALFSELDCQNSNGCIGGGFASTLATDRHKYLLIETPTKNLTCTAGQDWPFQLYRSQSFATKTGGWESFSSNPLISSPRRSDMGCDLQYAHFFKDGAETYLMVSYQGRPHLEFYPTAIFKLTPKSQNAKAVIRFSDEFLDAISAEPPMPPAQNPLFMTWDGGASSFFHQLGRAHGTAWEARPEDGEAYMTYGPYLQTVPPGRSQVRFYLSVGSLTGAAGSSSDPILLLDVNDAKTNRIVASREVKAKDLSPTGVQIFSLEFNSNGSNSFEFRIRTNGRARILHLKTELKQ
jgi:hypothetical protein